MQSICIFCGSSTGRNSSNDYLDLFFDHMVAEGFLLPAHKDMLLLRDNPAAILESLLTFELPVLDKWGNFKSS
ncbi:MAG: hypothetical protein JSW26_05645 [Desulfobacterales bacterium]|nr:MAG: hypothetical protein JSW26_05645 [Desulfobacterales bacterium]